MVAFAHQRPPHDKLRTMKKYISLFFLAILSFMHWGCQRQLPTNCQVISIDNKNTNQKLLSDYFELYKVCPLETTDQNIIGQIKRIEIYNGDIYILDEINNCVFQHDSTGRYIRTLNRIGRGPEEYMRLTDMKVNVQGLFLVDYTQQAMLQYDHDLKFIRKIHFDCFPFEFKFFKDKLFIYSERNNTNNDYCFYETDFQ